MECMAVAESRRANIVMTEQATMVCQRKRSMIDAGLFGILNQGLPQSLHLQERERTLVLIGSVIFRNQVIQTAVVKERTPLLE